MLKGIFNALRSKRMQEDYCFMKKVVKLMSAKRYFMILSKWVIGSRADWKFVGIQYMAIKKVEILEQQAI